MLTQREGGMLPESAPSPFVRMGRVGVGCGELFHNRQFAFCSGFLIVGCCECYGVEIGAVL